MKVRRDSWLIFSLYLRRFRPALTSYIRVEGADQWDAQGAGPAARRLHDGLHRNNGSWLVDAGIKTGAW